MRTTLLVLMVSGLAVAQDLKKNAGEKKDAAPANVDPRRIDAAIDRGVAWLKGQAAGIYGEDLVLWTLVVSGLTEKDDDVRTMTGRILRCPLERTYHVALQAMILEKLDRVKYQARIAECAQFLVDSMGPDGMWTYTGVVEAPIGTTGGGNRGEATGSLKKKPKDAASEGTNVVATGPGGGDVSKKKDEPVAPKDKPVEKWIEITKRRDGPRAGDHSNTQYAALGLRACHDAGIALPVAVIEKAAEQWRKSQQQGKGARGWNYSMSPGMAWGSMTAGGLGSLMIYDHILGKDYRKDADVIDGLAWLAEHFTVAENPEGRSYSRWHYYYLYGLERAGMLYGTETIGRHEWYAEGAAYLLKEQSADGSWKSKEGFGAVDSCFAILFLKRATVTLDKEKQPKPKPPPKPKEESRPDVETGKKE